MTGRGVSSSRARQGSAGEGEIGGGLGTGGEKGRPARGGSILGAWVAGVPLDVKRNPARPSP